MEKVKKQEAELCPTGLWIIYSYPYFNQVNNYHSRSA